MAILDSRQRSQPAIGELLAQIQPKLKAVLYRYRIPAEDAEDLLQQAFLSLVYQSETVQDPAAWLVGTLRNKCRVYWRSHRRRLYDAVDSTLLDWLADPTMPEQERQELSHDLNSLIARLTWRCRELLRLRYGLGYEPSEVASKLGYRPSSISKLTTRCLAALTRQMVRAGFCKERKVRG